MKLASHNSWSYLRPVKWWMRLLGFTSKCQDEDIQTQYEVYDVRCFDLRIKFRNNQPILVHGKTEYQYSKYELIEILQWLDGKRDVYIRVILDIRTKKEYTQEQKDRFIEYCNNLEEIFTHIRFWCGRGLYDWKVIYFFDEEPTCEEKYSSVCKPKYLDDWYPRWFAKCNNHKILEEGTDKDFLMIDFVNYT